MTVGLVPEGPRLHVAGIYIDEKRFENWTDYSIISNIFNPSDSFSMRAGRVDAEIRDLLLPGKRIQIYFGDGSPDGDVIVHDGWVEGNSDTISKLTTDDTINITGRDRASDLVENSVPRNLKVAGRNLLDIAKELCAPFGINVIATNEINRLAVADPVKKKKILSAWEGDVRRFNERMGLFQDLWFKQFKQDRTEESWKRYLATQAVPAPVRPPMMTGIYNGLKSAAPQDGESIWAFISRYASRQETFLFMSATGGDLIMQRPRYDQDPSYLFLNASRDPSNNNVVSRTRNINVAGMPTKITRTGRLKKVGEKRERMEAEVFSVKLLPESEAILVPAGSIVVADDFVREKWVTDTDARDQDELDRRNFYGMKSAETGFISLNVTVRGHDQGGRLYTPDTVARFVDEDLGLDELFYIPEVQYRLDQKSPDMEGPATSLTLKPLYSWVPEELE